MKLLYGLSWSLPFPAPELPETDRPAEVSVVFGEFDEHAIAWTQTGVCYKAAPGAYFLAVPGVARYLLTEGNRIIIDAPEQVGVDEISHFLFHPVAGALLMQRGILPLQASVVEKDGKAAIFLGSTASGKSVLAAGLMQHGFKVMSDSICAVYPGKESIIKAGAPQLQLWSQTLRTLDHDPAGLRRIRPDIKKYLLPVPQDSYTLSATVDRLYLLADGDERPSLETPLAGQKKFALLQGYSYHNPLVEAFGMQKEMFRIMVNLIQNRPLSRVSSPHVLQHAREFIDSFASRY